MASAARMYPPASRNVWPIRPLATCTVWVALDWSVPENGCMRYIPRSHTGQVYRHRKDDRSDLALDLVLEDAHRMMAVVE